MPWCCVDGKTVRQTSKTSKECQHSDEKVDRQVHLAVGHMKICKEYKKKCAKDYSLAISFSSFS